MKFNKVMTAVGAAAAAALTVSFAAGASVAPVENPAAGLEAGSGSWKVLLRSEAVDQGVKVEDVAKFTLRFTTDDPEFFEGQFGGSLFMTCGPASDTPEDHNWVQSNWWGVVDEALEINTQNPDEAILTTKVGDYTYELSIDVNETNCLYANSTYAGAGLQEWGSDMSQLVVLGATFYDASGNVLIAYDGSGNVVSGNTSAPATGSADAATDSSNGSPQTGVEDMAAAAGLAILAGGAALIARKRK